MSKDRLDNLKEFIESNRERGLAHVDSSWDIKSFNEQDIFYIILFCILVPGGRAKRADLAVEKLKELNYCYAYLTDYRLFKLLKPLVRFPKQKFERVKEFKKTKTKIIQDIIKLHKETNDLDILRKFLVNNINGFGYKASSHFLRNMGIKDLAIIDTHILKYTKYFISEDLQDIKPNTEKNYKLLEDGFNKWAREVFNLKPAYLDWFIWCFEAGVDVEEMDR